MDNLLMTAIEKGGLIAAIITLIYIIVWQSKSLTESIEKQAKSTIELTNKVIQMVEKMDAIQTQNLQAHGEMRNILQVKIQTSDTIARVESKLDNISSKFEALAFLNNR